MSIMQILSSKSQLTTISLPILALDILKANFLDLYSQHDDCSKGAYRLIDFDKENLKATYEWTESTKLQENKAYQDVAVEAKTRRGKKVIFLLDNQAVLLNKPNAAFDEEYIFPKAKPETV
jgi:hypothetical protein